MDDVVKSKILTAINALTESAFQAKYGLSKAEVISVVTKEGPTSPAGEKSRQSRPAPGAAPAGEAAPGAEEVVVPRCGSRRPTLAEGAVDQLVAAGLIDPTLADGGRFGSRRPTLSDGAVEQLVEAGLIARANSKLPQYGTVESEAAEEEEEAIVLTCAKSEDNQLRAGEDNQPPKQAQEQEEYLCCNKVKYLSG